MPGEGEVLDFIPPTSMARVANVRTFAGMLPFDIWMGNTDQRQAVFWKMHTAWHLNACFIDHGFCLSGPRWEFLEHKPGRALYSDRTVYKDIHNWDSFEPYLSSIEHTSLSDITEIAARVPTCWHSSWRQLSRLMGLLHVRRLTVRDVLGRCMRWMSGEFPTSKDRGVGAVVPMIEAKDERLNGAEICRQNSQAVAFALQKHEGI